MQTVLPFDDNEMVSAVKWHVDNRQVKCEITFFLFSPNALRWTAVFLVRAEKQRYGQHSNSIVQTWYIEQKQNLIQKHFCCQISSWLSHIVSQSLYYWETQKKMAFIVQYNNVDFQIEEKKHTQLFFLSAHVLIAFCCEVAENFLDPNAKSTIQNVRLFSVCSVTSLSVQTSWQSTQIYQMIFTTNDKEGVKGGQMLLGLIHLRPFAWVTLSRNRMTY